MDKKSKILIIEDERIIAEDISLTLQTLGYNVCAIGSTGEEAVSLAKNLKPDLILMDIRLKGKMDGIQAAEKILSSSRIPIIYVTAYADEKTLQRAKITEPYGYVLKPIRQIELHSAIEIGIYKHEMEEKLKESELKIEREKLNTIKELGGAVAHEFNQPLQSLMILSKLMLTESKAKREEISVQLFKDVERMSVLVQRLLNLHTVKTKSYAGKSKIIDLLGSSKFHISTKKSVLLIDDEESILNLLSRIIEKEGYDIDRANSGKKAISLLNKNDYGLVICDIQLPDLSGVDLYQQSRKMNKKTPFVFISGYTVDEIGKSVIDSSAGFLAKPFKVSDILEILNSVFKA
ncbi:MAG: response regulator [Candidatus Marinimicrobia bacterium]|nr:response regulator [Candidatus Neomarinimicrobiota bacterium]